MAYRKFKGDRLFIGNSWAPDRSVLITTEKGRVETILPEEEAGNDIEQLEGIICPGFINAHCHLELSHLHHQIPPHTGMVKFLLSVMNLRGTPLETIQEAMKLADQSMYDSGIVAVGDICNTDQSLALKQNSTIRYYNFIEAMGFVAAGAPQRFEAARELTRRFGETGPASLVPHAPYSVSPELFQLINQSPAPVRCMHNQESKAEAGFFLHGDSDLRELYRAIGVDLSFFNPPGSSSLAAVLPWLSNCEHLMLVHNVTTSPEDLDLLSRFPSEVFFCLCPNANEYINQSAPPLHLLEAKPDHIVLGTDSLASNYQLSITEEIKSIRKTYPTIPLERLLQWATLNGARALKMDGELGSFEKGKTPGVVQLHEDQSRRII
jgi:cytosine/adenosine deaminase-related metal-dependent hydrolase